MDDSAGQSSAAVSHERRERWFIQMGTRARVTDKPHSSRRTSPLRAPYGLESRQLALVIAGGKPPLIGVQPDLVKMHRTDRKNKAPFLPPRRRRVAPAPRSTTAGRAP